LPKDTTSELASLFSHHSFNTELQAVNTKVVGRPGNQTQVYRLRGERSNYWATYRYLYNNCQHALASISKKIEKFQEQPKEGPQNSLSTYNFSGLAMCPLSLRKKQIWYERMLQCRPTTHHFLNQENPTRNLQRSCAHYSTTYGRISIRVPLWLSDVGRTSLRLQNRIIQHIPKSIRDNQKPTNILPKWNCK